MNIYITVHHVTKLFALILLDLYETICFLLFFCFALYLPKTNDFSVYFFIRKNYNMDELII